MIEPITKVLMLLMQPCYDLTQNWWLALLLFTALVKLILLPLSLWCQKNSIVMVQLIPDLNRIKMKHFGDQEAIGEAQSALYKQRHYHPLLSLIPLAVQIIILFGLVDVVHYITDNGFAGTEFLGAQPTVDGGLSWVMPLLAGLSAVVMGYAQNRINPLQREQSRTEKNVTNGLSIGLSLFLGVFVAAGMCFYWICSNVLSIAIQALCNIIIKPGNYIDYDDVRTSTAELESLQKLGKRKKAWFEKDPLAAREKADYRRFQNVAGKHIVFYAEGGSFYRYFQGAIEYLLKTSTCPIHYVTNDPNDQVFELARTQTRLIPYYIGEQKAITLLMKLDADVFVATLEDLNTYYLKRSYVRSDIEYVFMFHHMLSTNLTPTPTAYDAYDTLLCVGPHQIAEVREREERAQLAPKRLVSCGYDLLDREIAAFGALTSKTGTPALLIAPSWQEDNLLDSCIDALLEQLLSPQRLCIVRPHPEYVKRFKARWEALQARYSHLPAAQLYFEQDFSSSESIYTADVLITDWSSISCEFSFSTLKPCIFIDTPIKAYNPDWQESALVPTDISLRSQLGVSFDPSQLEGLDATVQDMLENSQAWNERIRAIREGFIFNLGHGGETAGEYLLSAVLDAQEKRS